MTTTDTTTIRLPRQLYTRGQNFHLTELLAVPGNTALRFRLTVHTDSHVPQAYARAERWGESGWHEVHTIPGECMQSPLALAYKRLSDEAKASYCRSDLDTLVRAVEFVTGVRLVRSAA